MNEERWLPVVGYEGLYEVSDAGRVRSLDRTLPFRQSYRSYRGRILRPAPQSSGHLHLDLHRDSASRTYRVHQIVMAAFVGAPPSGQEIRHLNGKPADNRLTNLAYGTRSENKYDEVRHGVHPEANRTHCPSGHPYDEENTYRPPSRLNSRHCRACHRDRSRERKRRLSASA